MKIFISGGGGYLARRLINSLSTQHEIYTSYRGDMATDGSATWIHERDMPADLPGKIDSVIHLAQSSRYREFPDSACDMFSSNVAMTHALLEYARVAGAKTFVYSSTGGVYERSAGKLHEHDLMRPGDFYAASKLASEALVKPYEQFYKTAVLRLFFLYGPGQKNRLIPILVDRISNGQSIELTDKKDGLLITPTYVDDVAKVVHRAAENGWNGTFNVASPEVLSMRKIATIIGEAVGKKVEFKQLENDSTGNLVPDLENLSKHYDLDDFLSFEKGLEISLDQS
jgi:nucleoside-diphosphate-sugar epimerase